MAIQAYDKAKLKNGKIVKIVEILGGGAAFIAEVYKEGEGLTIEQILLEEITSVIKEVEYPLASAS
jgi:hypothetical protein